MQDLEVAHQPDENNETTYGIVMKEINCSENEFQFISKIFYTYPYVKGIKIPEKAIALGTNFVDCLDLASNLRSVRGEQLAQRHVYGVCEIKVDVEDEDVNEAAAKHKSFSNDYDLGSS